MLTQTKEVMPVSEKARWDATGSSGTCGKLQNTSPALGDFYSVGQLLRENEDQVLPEFFTKQD